MKNVVVLFLLIFAVVCCKKKKGSEEEADSFNKKPLMENLANNLILDNYTELDLALSEFEAKYNAFVGDQTALRFAELQDAWKLAYIQWQRSLMYEIGPGMEQLMKVSFGTFPTDTTKILNNISTGTYNLDQVSNFTAQGLPAFDFMLYRPNAMSFFAQTNYSDYGSALIDKMQGHLTAVISGWNSGYLSSFNNSTGTEATSSFSMLVNSFVKSYEECKWTKIGIPIGNQSMGTPQPAYIETRRAKFSFELMRENMLALQRLFNGNKNDGTQGIGFDDYLIALEKTELVNDINSEFDGIVALIDAYNQDFETVLNTDPASLQVLYNKVHYLTVYLKTDMTSAFGVLITYQDNDGD